MNGTQDIGIETLTEMALNLRWSWNRSTDELWARLDPEEQLGQRNTRPQLSEKGRLTPTTRS